MSLVIGTRPEAIKLKPVAHALAAQGLTPTLIFTGQHPDLDPGAFGLSSFPVTTLRCPGEANPHAHVRTVMSALAAHLAVTPDLLVVQGDTSSALGAARAGFAKGIPVAHVEAGLRTHDPSLPWPEEEYRVAIDAAARLLFAPTELAAANLRAEKVPGQIHVTGNSGIDALVEAETRLPAPSLAERARPRLLVTCHRRESWRNGLESIAGALADLAERDAEIELVNHPNRFVADTMRRAIRATGAIRMIAPCSHEELLCRMRDADLVLSDSGGVQEEAPALGVPLLILREKTERPEGIAAGTSRLVGTGRDGIVSEVRHLLNNPLALARMRRREYPFGDGRAAPRIATLIRRWLARQDQRAGRVGRLRA